MIKRAIMSLWTAPCKDNLHKAWRNQENHSKAWTVSSNLLRRHFSEVGLVTDKLGWEYLKQLQLPFTDVVVCLDEIDTRFAKYWSMGKIKAYSIQDVPFVHVDADAFVFKPFSSRILTADLCAQTPTRFRRVDSNNYKIRKLLTNVSIPNEIRTIADKSEQYAANTGIFGGNDLNTIRYHSELVNECLKLDPDGWEANFTGWEGLMLLEEWMIAVAAQLRNSTLEYVCQSIQECLNPIEQEKIGFVHLWSSHKRDAGKLKSVFDKYESIKRI